MNNRTLSAVALGSFIIAVAIGLIVYVATGKAMMTLWTALLIIGIALVAMSFLYPSESGKFRPPESIYILAAGVIIAVIGVIGMLQTYTNVNIWILVAIFLIALALVGIFAAVFNGKKEGQ